MWEHLYENHQHLKFTVHGSRSFCLGRTNGLRLASCANTGYRCLALKKVDTKVNKNEERNRKKKKAQN